MSKIIYRPTHSLAGETWDTWLCWHEGTLRLGWRAGNNRLEDQRKEIAFSTDSTSGMPVLMLPETFDTPRGVILEYRLILPPTSFATRRGIYIRIRPKSRYNGVV